MAAAEKKQLDDEVVRLSAELARQREQMGTENATLAQARMELENQLVEARRELAEQKVASEVQMSYKCAQHLSAV